MGKQPLSTIVLVSRYVALLHRPTSANHMTTHTHKKIFYDYKLITEDFQGNKFNAKTLV